MGHPGERWRNVVTAGQPTRLSGVGHTGTGAGPGSCLYPVLAPPCSRRRERTAPVAVPLVERGTPGALLRHGREAGWKAAPGRGGEGGGQQPTPSGHGLETGGDMPRRASAPPARRCGRTRAPAAPPPGPGPRLAAPAAGAVAPLATAGPARHGQAVPETGRRLQARLGQATPAGPGPTVRAGPPLLTHASSGTARAGRRVTEPPGHNTPGGAKGRGPDPVRPEVARPQRRTRGETARPRRRVAIPTPHGQHRPLGLPTRQDRARHAWSLRALDPSAATTAAPNAYGVRQDRSGADARAQGATGLSTRPRPPWLRAGDSPACLDPSRQAGWLTPLPLDKALRSPWWPAGDRAKAVLDATDAGTPQGGGSAPGLAPRTLDGLEPRRRKPSPPAGVRALQGQQQHGHVGRDADDFGMPGLSQEGRAQEGPPRVVAFLQQRGLARSDEHPRRTPLEAGWDGLGPHGRKSKGPCLRRPAQPNVQTFLASLRKGIKDNTHATASGRIALLTPTIWGWAHLPRHAAAQATFGPGDTARCTALGRWARRRPPTPGRRGAAHRDCGRVGNTHWRCGGTAKDHKGTTLQPWLCRAAAPPTTPRGPPPVPHALAARGTRPGAANAPWPPAGRRKAVPGLAAPHPSHPGRAGITTPASPTRWGAQTACGTACCSIPTAPDKGLPQVARCRTRVPSKRHRQGRQGRYARLEPDAGQRARPVLRAGGGSNAASLTRQYPRGAAWLRNGMVSHTKRA